MSLQLVGKIFNILPFEFLSLPRISFSFLMSRKRTIFLALLLLPFVQARPSFAHGSHGGGGDVPEAGEFNFTPVITIEGHGGFENNLEDDPKHYALDGLFGGVFQWGLELSLIHI